MKITKENLQIAKDVIEAIKDRCKFLGHGHYPDYVSIDDIEGGCIYIDVCDNGDYGDTIVISMEDLNKTVGQLQDEEDERERARIMALEKAKKEKRYKALQKLKKEFGE